MVSAVRAGDSRRSGGPPFRGQSPDGAALGRSGRERAPRRRLGRSVVGAPASGPPHRHRAMDRLLPRRRLRDESILGEYGAAAVRRELAAAATTSVRRSRRCARFGRVLAATRGARREAARPPPGAADGLVPAGARHAHHRARLVRHHRGPATSRAARSSRVTALRASARWRRPGRPGWHGRSWTHHSMAGAWSRLCPVSTFHGTHGSRPHAGGGLGACRLRAAADSRPSASTVAEMGAHQRDARARGPVPVMRPAGRARPRASRRRPLVGPSPMPGASSGPTALRSGHLRPPYRRAGPGQPLGHLFPVDPRWPHRLVRSAELDLDEGAVLTHHLDERGRGVPEPAEVHHLDQAPQGAGWESDGGWTANVSVLLAPGADGEPWVQGP